MEFIIKLMTWNNYCYQSFMRSILLTVFVLITQLAFAQKDLIGIRGGLNWTDVINDSPFENSDPSTGFIGGISYERQLESGVYWGADFLYAQRGFEDDLFPGAFDPCIGCLRVAAPVNNQFNYDYVSVPIQIGYTFGNELKFFADVALVPSWLVQSDIEAGDFFSQEIEGVDSFDLGSQIELGTSYEISENWHLFGALGYFHGLTSITNDRYFRDNKIIHRSIGLSFGVKYELNRG
ncbi:MAG: outer membrane beta-barrel protein [Cytophagales bacterium]|nr:outer membrane beta-barrel protein [Cytophagales bacterium]